MVRPHDGLTPVTAASRETVERAAKVLSDRGLEVEERRPAGIERGFELWFGFLGQAGVPGIVRMYDGKEELMGPLIQALKAIIQPVTTDQFLGAWMGRDALRASVVTEMMDYPIILAPVTAAPVEHDHRAADSTIERSEIATVGVQLLDEYTSWITGGGCALRRLPEACDKRHDAGSV